ncbi:hypothetical protein Dimus_035966 [Dionaea muscipula]
MVAMGRLGAGLNDAYSAADKASAGLVPPFHEPGADSVYTVGYIIGDTVPLLDDHVCCDGVGGMVREEGRDPPMTQEAMRPQPADGLRRLPRSSEEPMPKNLLLSFSSHLFFSPWIRLGFYAHDDQLSSTVSKATIGKMGFNMVYRTLLELFPQVDARILKAVTIEHAKDVEGAVEAILTEVVPYVRQHDASIFSCLMMDGTKSEAVKGDGSIKKMADATGAIGNDLDQQFGNMEVPDAMPCVVLTNSAVEESGADFYLSNDQSVHSECISPVHSHYLDSSTPSDVHMEESCGYGTSINLALLDAKDQASGAEVYSLSPEVEQGGDNLGKLTEGLSKSTVDLDESSAENTVATQSGKFCGMDILEQIIEDAKSHKKSLDLAMELVIGLIREVGLQEKSLEQVKEAAANGGLETLAEVEALRNMLVHAKEANDMVMIFCVLFLMLISATVVIFFPKSAY